jgi:hypothetical protein
MLQVLWEDTEEILQWDIAISLYFHLRWQLTPKRRNIHRIRLDAASLRSVHNVGMEECVLEVVEGQPKISIKRLERTTAVSLSVSVCAEVSTTWWTCNTWIMSMNFAAISQRPNIYSKRCTHLWILLHSDWDHQHSQRTSVIRRKS